MKLKIVAKKPQSIWKWKYNGKVYSGRAVTLCCSTAPYIWYRNLFHICETHREMRERVKNENEWNKLQSYLFYFVAANHLPSTRSHFLILFRFLLLTPPFNTCRYPLAQYSWRIHQTEHISSEHLFSWLKLNGQCQPASVLYQVDVKQVPLYTDISTFYVCTFFQCSTSSLSEISIMLSSSYLHAMCQSGTKPFTLLPLQSNRFLIFFSISQNWSVIFFHRKKLRPHTSTAVRHSSTFVSLCVESMDVQLSISTAAHFNEFHSKDEFHNGF